MTDRGVGHKWIGDSLIADFTNDGAVDYHDLMYMGEVWLTGDSEADISPIGGDGSVNFRDFVFFTSQWLKQE